MTLDVVLIGFAFSAGAIAFLNPCGFAMLPSYISYFVERTTNSIPIKPQARKVTASNKPSVSNNNNNSINCPPVTHQHTPIRRLIIGAVIGLLVTTGFVAIFGLTGLAVSAVGTTIAKIFPWIAVLGGIIIIGIGVAKIFGKSIHINISLPSRLIYSSNSSSVTNTTTTTNGTNIHYRSRIPCIRFFLFGIGYAVASLSCTLPIFLLVVFQGLSIGGIGEGMIVFLSYALGMGSVMVAISIAISISNQTFVRHMRKIAPRMNTITSLVLILAGSYIVYYNLVIGKLLLL